MARIILKRLRVVLQPLISLKGLEEDKCHKFLALELDPEYKSFWKPFRELHSSKIEGGRRLAALYDNEALIPLLIQIYKKQERRDGLLIPDDV